MKGRSRTTLKDIAERCGVTPTAVSAVLNHSRGRISCSLARRAEILRVADELGYRPNLLARSMVVKRVPLVGVMLHLSEKDFNNGHNQYFMELLPSLTFRFNACAFEVLFIPYADEKDQVRRLDSLSRNGLLGGVVSNIIPHSNTEIGTYLKKSELPYMILGYPDDRELYHAFATIDYAALLSPYLKDHPVEQIYFVVSYTRQIKFLRHPFPDNYFWLAAKAFPTAAEFASERTLFVLMGSSILELLKHQGIRCRHQLVVGSPDKAKFIPENIPYLLVDSSTFREKLADEVVARLTHWMRDEHLPKSAQFKLNLGPEITVGHNLSNNPNCKKVNFTQEKGAVSRANFFSSEHIPTM